SGLPGAAAGAVAGKANTRPSTSAAGRVARMLSLSAVRNHPLGGDDTAVTAADRFRELHARDRLFVMPNPWDVGSAKLLAALGFEALATTSAGFALSIGKRDQTVTRDELVAHVAAL